MIKELNSGDQLICIKDMTSKRGKLFFKGGVYTVSCRINPSLAENSYNIYNPVSTVGHTMLDIDSINQHFIPYDTYAAFKYCM